MTCELNFSDTGVNQGPASAGRNRDPSTLEPPNPTTTTAVLHRQPALERKTRKPQTAALRKALRSATCTRSLGDSG